MVAGRGEVTLCISKVKGHADEEMVQVSHVREIDRIGNGRVDEAADIRRKRVDPVVIDARRNLSGVCRLWELVALELHRFYIAISRAELIIRVRWVRRQVHWCCLLVPFPSSPPQKKGCTSCAQVVRNDARLRGPDHIWGSSWVGILPTAIYVADGL